MSKLAAALMSSAAHPPQPEFKSSQAAQAKPVQRKGGWPPQQHSQPSRRRQHGSKRDVMSDDGQADDDGDDAGEPDELVPDPIVCREFNISAMTLWRWDRDPELAALGFPPPVTIRKRKFRIRKQLETFKRTMLRRAIAQRAESQAGSSKMRG
jgi:hypothetical protein